MLGYNWLTCYNPLIDWVLSCITFPATSKENPVPDPRPSMRATVSEEMEPQPFCNNSDSDTREENPTPNVTPKINISLVNAEAYIRACKLPGTQEFTLNLKDFSARATPFPTLLRWTFPRSQKNTTILWMSSTRPRPTLLPHIGPMI